MKRMVYIVIAVTGLLVAGVLFAGCSISPEENSRQFTGMSLSQNHMNFGYCYSFYLREEDSQVLFDAQVRFSEEPYEIILEGCVVDKACMKELRALDKQYKITEYVKTYKKKTLPFNSADETVNKTTVYFSDGTDKTADTDREYREALYNFFSELSKQYSDESVAVNTY